jgi:hypothetical protein
MSTPWIIAFAVLWATVLLLALVVLGVLRRLVGVLERAENYLPTGSGGTALGLDPGARASPFEGILGERGAVSSEELLRNTTLMLFMEADCGPCATLAQELHGIRDTIEGVTFYVVLDEEHGDPTWMPRDIQLLYEQKNEISRAFLNNATPQAYVIDERRRILARRPVNSLASLAELATVSRANGGNPTPEHALTAIERIETKEGV